MIDIFDEEETNKKCIRYQHKLTGSVNIVYNATNSMICLWNKYQIFIHERLNFEDAANTIIPEFQIQQTLLIDNYLFCLDCSGNVHLISLKFKHSAAKRFKGTFSPKDHNILSIQHIGNDVISIKKENSKYYICSYKMNTDFKLTRKQEIDMSNFTCETTKCLLFLQALSLEEFNSVKEFFNSKDCIWNNHFLIIISFDSTTLFGCLFSAFNDVEPTLVKIYACPTEIVDVKILNRNHLEIIIGLSSGTLIKLAINAERSYNIVHLNSCLNKFLEINNSILYTDGCTMWKVDDTFKNNTFTQVFVKQAKDFVKCSERIICTTYTNFIYIFCIDDKSSYLKPVSVDEYCSAEYLLNNTQYLHRIEEEVKKMVVSLEQLNEEKNHITTLALSNRHDLMDTIIQYGVTVFDSYEDVLKENRVLTFSDEPKDIFDMDTYYFLINITTSHQQHNFSEILSNLFGDLRIHITLLTNENIIKTTTITVLENLKKMDVVVTLKNKYLDLGMELFVNLKLVTKIPGVLDAKRNLWTCLHEKNIPLTSEHFIKTSKTSKSVYLKQINTELDELIFKTLNNQFGTLFHIKKSMKTNTNDWVFFVKLPSNYKHLFKSEDYCEKYLNKRKCHIIRELISSEDFLKSQSTLIFNIGDEKTEIEILNDGFSRPILKVVSANVKVALEIRNFISNLLYKDFVDTSQEMVVNWSLYSVVETLHRAVKECVLKGRLSEEIFDLHQTFQRNIIANVPI